MIHAFNNSFNEPIDFKDPVKTAHWIFRCQDELNHLSLRLGQGTIDIGKSGDSELILDTAKKYLRAFLSECSENLDNFFWKHWSREAKSGLYFYPVVHESIPALEKARKFSEEATRRTGVGLTPEQEELLAHVLCIPERLARESMQNVKVELVDMLFFLVSISQVLGLDIDFWTSHWSAGWGEGKQPQIEASDRNALSVDYTMSALAQLTDAVNQFKSGADSSGKIIEAISSLKRACALFFTLEEIHAGYAVKLKINYERQTRGRLQVGDALSEIENKQV